MNGVIVLDNRVNLAEGQEVTILASVPRSARVGVPHSVLDIPAVSVGAVLRPLAADDDLLDEMLDGRS